MTDVTAPTGAIATETAEPPKRRSAARGWLAREAGAVRAQTTLATGFGVASGLLAIPQAVVIALLLAAAIDPDGASAGPLTLAGLLGLVFLVRALLAYAQDRAGFAASASVKSSVRLRLLERIARLKPTAQDLDHTGGLAALLLEQVEALDGYFSRFRAQIVIAVAVPVAIVATAFAVDWLAGLVLLIAAPLIPLAMGLVGMGAAKASKSQLDTLRRMSGYFLDRLQGLTTLKLFGQAEAELGRILAVSEDFRKRTMGVLKLAFLSSFALEAIAAGATAIVAVYVGLALLGRTSIGPAEALTLTEGILLVLLSIEVFQPLRLLSAQYHDGMSAVGAAEALLVHDVPVGETMPVSSTDRTPVPKGPAPALLPAIVFEAVTVRYETPGGTRRALETLGFTAAAGEITALVGESGSGKSTALGIVLGHVKPTAGRASLGDRPLAPWPNGHAPEPDPTHIEVAWVGQRAHVFHGTIAENLRLGRPDATDAELCEAAQIAGFLEVIEALPLGLATIVGERGFGLSGGQAQRLALARAFLSQAPVLLLDEPTAHLDADNEELIAKAVERLRGRRTVLIATHSPRLAAIADRIVRVQSLDREAVA